jgi:transcription initiation factor TFIIH subunit 4
MYAYSFTYTMPLSSSTSFLNYTLGLTPSILTSLYSKELPTNAFLNPLTPPTLAQADEFSAVILRGLSQQLPRGNWAARTILTTLLSSVERSIVLRMAMLPPPASVSLTTAKSWFTESSSSSFTFKAEGLDLVKLERLGVMATNPSGDGAWFIRLEVAFHCQVRLAIGSTQKSPWKKPGESVVPNDEDDAPAPAPASAPAPAPTPATTTPPTTTTTTTTTATTRSTITPQQLELHTQSCWDSILHYLVGSQTHTDPPASVADFLIAVNLMGPDPDDDGAFCITPKGYDFMLQDVHLQVWQLVLQYLTNTVEKHKNAAIIRPEALLFLFSLTHCIVGVPYEVSRLNKAELSVMNHFAGFGLVLHDRPNATFYPTRVAVNLLSGATRASAENQSSYIRTPEASAALTRALSAPSVLNSPHLAIIVQTNFSVAAYTSSDLHMSMLGLFCSIETMTRLPNMIIATMTRESIKGAFAKGISAKQIIKFLKMHAHPQVLADPNEPIVPDNVENQIYLWDRERKRVKSDLCFKIQCIGGDMYKAIVSYSKRIGALLYSSEETHLVFVKYEKASFVTQYKRKLEQQAMPGVSVGDRQSSYN